MGVSNTGAAVDAEGLALHSVPIVARVQAPMVELRGHSYVQGKGSYNDLEGYAQRGARALSPARWVGGGYAGSIICHPNVGGTGDGGYAWLDQTLGPGPSPVNLPVPLAGTTGSSGRYGSRRCVFIHEHMLNDIAQLGPTNLGPALRAHERAWARACMTRLYNIGNAGVTKAGTWTVLSGAGVNSRCQGNGYWTSSVTGSTVSFTLESDMPSGLVVDVGFVVASADNVVVTITQNGSTVKTLTLQGSVIVDPAASYNGYVCRMGVPGDGLTFNAGDANVITVTTVTAGVVGFNYVAVEANPLDGPLLVIPLPSHLTAAGYAFYSGFPGGASMNNAAIDTAKAALLAILPAFGNRYVAVDFDLGQYTFNGQTVGWNEGGIINTAAFPAGSYASDGLHPNDYSHGQRAEQVLAAIMESGLLTRRIAAACDAQPMQFLYSLGGIASWGAQSLLGTTYQNSWASYDTQSTYTANYPGFARNEQDMVQLNGRIKGGATGTVAFTMPGGYCTSRRRVFGLTAGLDDQWTLTVSATAGNLTLPITAPGGTLQTTANIAYNAVASAVVTAITNAIVASNGVYNTGEVVVTCTGTLAGGMLITFVGPLAGKGVTVGTPNVGGLTGTAAVIHTTTAAIVAASAEIGNDSSGAGDGYVLINVNSPFSWVSLDDIYYLADC